MLINMDETRLRTIEQVEDFLRGSTSIESSAVGEDTQRYAQSSRVLKRFDYPGVPRRGVASCAAICSRRAAAAAHNVRDW